MKEQKLKNRMFIMLFIAKIFIISYIWLQTSTGGFDPTEAFTTISTIIPMLAVYFGVMYTDYINNSKLMPDTNTLPKMVSKRFSNIAHITMLFYIICFIVLIRMKASVTLTFPQFQTSLTTLEGGFGIYVGKIIFSLFGSAEK